METKTKIKLKNLIRECLQEERENRKKSLNEGFLKAILLALLRPGVEMMEKGFYDKHPEAAQSLQNVKTAINKHQEVLNKYFHGSEEEFALNLAGGDKQKAKEFLNKLGRI